MIKNIQGMNINYEIYGEGFPVLVLHGWGGCINSMLPIINGLKSNYKLIVIDFIGHGKSDFPLSPMGVPEYTSVVKDFIDELGINKLYLIGHSFGGRVSIMLAFLYPNLVKKMILVDSGGIKPKKTFKQICKVYSYKFVKNFLKIVMFNSKHYQDIMVNYRKKAGSSDYNALPENMKATFVKVVNQDLRQYLKNISTPTLVVWGECDQDTPLYMGKIIADGIKDSGLVVLKGAGHFSYIDNSAEFNLIALNFLGGN